MTETTCPACGQPVVLAQLSRAGTCRMVDPETVEPHVWYCLELTARPGGIGYQRVVPLPAVQPEWTTLCPNGHPHSQFWRLNSQGTHYCIACTQLAVRRTTMRKRLRELAAAS